jgi:hypothetical protein
MNLESSSGKNVPGGHTRRIHRLKRSLRVTEYSGGKTVQRRHRGKNKIVEYFVELCKEGIEKVQGVHKENSVLSSERRRVSRRRHSQSC